MSAQRPDTEDYRALFLEDVPLMDVRAPVEFDKGSFPTASNHPLMTDEERHLTGIRYKEAGQEAAVELGHELVHGDTKAQRINRWAAFARQHPHGYLFCFRGGLRSRITQQWLAQAGIDYPLVKGGYKALRRFLLDDFEQRVDSLPLRLVSGRTGSGKTRLLHRLPNPVDLEGMAEHRGSSFGHTLTPQPSQIDFENRLYIALLKASQQDGPIHMEDEGRLIGRRALPPQLQQRMKDVPMLVLEEPLEQRVDIILTDYVTDMAAAYLRRDGEELGRARFRDYLLGSLERIQKRLGGVRYQEYRDIMSAALDEQERRGDPSLHREWIRSLLETYYDPMYDYQLSRNQGRILARGDRETLAAQFS